MISSTWVRSFLVAALMKFMIKTSFQIDKNNSGRQSIKNEISGRLGVIGIQMCIGFLARF